MRRSIGRGGIGWTFAALAVALAGVTTGAGPTAGVPGVAPSSTSTAASSDVDRGHWRILAAGEGRYVVSWTSPTRLPVGSDRPTIVGRRDTTVGAPSIGA